MSSLAEQLLKVQRDHRRRYRFVDRPEPQWCSGCDWTGSSAGFDTHLGEVLAAEVERPLSDS